MMPLGGQRSSSRQASGDKLRERTIVKKIGLHQGGSNPSSREKSGPHKKERKKEKHLRAAAAKHR